MTKSDDMFPGALPKEIGQADLAELVGLTRIRLHQLKAEGMPTVGRGRYNLADTIQWMLTYWKTRNARAGNNLDSHRKRLLKAQATKAEIDNDERMKQLIPVGMVSTTLNQVATTISTQLDALAPRLAGELTNQTDTAYVKKVIADETRQIRIAIADSIDDIAIAENDGENHQAAAGEDR